MTVMAPKRTDSKRGDGKRPKQAGRLIRVRVAFLTVIDRQADEDVTTPTELVNQLVREGLERRSLWPPKAD